MKKSVVVLVVAIALLSVILVAFTGATNTIVDNQTVYVSQIILLNQTLKNPADPSKDIYRVLEKPANVEQSEEKETFLISQEENIWADYVIQIRNYNYFYDYLGNSLKLEAKVLPDEATNKTLVFNGRTKDEVYAVVSNEGEVKYQVKLEQAVVIAIQIAATDGSGVTCNVKIQSWMYI